MSKVALVLLLAGAWLWPLAVAHARLASRVVVSLHASSTDPAPGRTTMLAIRFTPDPGWHGYWSNPGDSGLPPSVTWDVPIEVRIGALQHPAPTVLKVAGMTSYVHGDEHVLLAPMRVPASLHAGDPLAVKGEVDFLVCSESLCVPQKANVSVNLIVGKGMIDPASRTLFAAARQAMPRTLSNPGEFTVTGRTLSLLVPASAKIEPEHAHFFPAKHGLFERSAARRLPDGSVEISGAMAYRPPVLSGVVSDGRRALQLRFVAASAPPPPAPTAIAAQPHIPAETRSSVSRASPPPLAPVATTLTSAADPVVPTGSVWALLVALISCLLLTARRAMLQR